jgi:hypothetical protein
LLDVADLRCHLCGKQHTDLPRAVAYRRPIHYFGVPEHERARRCQENDDLCVIDGREFLVRGVLSVPIRDAEGEFEWGCWALVAKEDFERMYQRWDDDCSHEAPVPGRLSIEPPGYEGLYLEPVMVQLRTASERPAFTLAASSNHRLAREQREGITLSRCHDILAVTLPWLFGSA